VRGLVYSRPGYGRSTPRAAQEAWGLDFMHRQAHEVLPALLQALGVQEPIWLFGHSDGGSIALLHAAHSRDRTAGAIVLAPHILVEDLSVASIEKARSAYRDTDLRARLARYHDDPDSAFWGWNDIWLHPPFKQWSIEREIETIACPLLAVQGTGDEYGTLEQIRGIARRLPKTRLLELPDCGHSPHRDQPERLIEAAVAFLHDHA
jgi:pimeloyl-ACP methyl ester carboxylesterase